MKFEFTNFGYIDNGIIEIADLTIISGPNNVGKTYISYAAYGFFKYFQRYAELQLEKSQIENLMENGALQVDLLMLKAQAHSCFDKVNEKFSENLETFFNAPDDYFSNSKVRFSSNAFEPIFSLPLKSTVFIGKNGILRFNKAENDSKLDITLQTNNQSNLPKNIINEIIAFHLARWLFERQLPAPFVITSERTGISLFYKELDINKNAILDNLTDNDKIQAFEILNNRSRYAEPIKDNIDIIRDYEHLSKSKSFLKENKQNYKGVFDALQNLLGGSFKNLDNQVFYRPKKEKGRELVSIPVYIASSSIKSLFLFDYYINCLAEEGGILIIDEPELNLHPDNQRTMAGLLARLVNAGVKVIVTTHSDYLVREINNRIMLHNDISDKHALMKKYGFISDDILKPEQVAAYCLGSSHKIDRLNVDRYGIDLVVFDELITNSNQIADEIYFNIAG